MSLIPMPGFALVEIKKKYESGLNASKEKYATNSEGKLIDVATVGEFAEDLGSFYGDQIGNTVYFAAFSDGETIKEDGKEYVFVATGELRGAKVDA